MQTQPQFKPVMQTKLHKQMWPVEDRGNCFAACVASVLGLHITEVPPFENHMHEMWIDKFYQWLTSRGLMFQRHNTCPVNQYAIAIGASPRYPTQYHAVIYYNNQMVHDPHPDNKGILSVHHFMTIEPHKR